MKRNKFLKAAVALWVVAAVGLAMWQGNVLAKYTDMAVGWGRAQVAKWALGEKRGPANDDGEPVLIVFEPGTTAAQRTTTVSLVNNSEVTARYVMEASVYSVDAYVGEAPFLAAIKASIEANANYDPVSGVELSPGSQATLDIIIPPVNFRGLEIAAVAVQVD